jgi:hypothetical protein
MGSPHNGMRGRSHTPGSPGGGSHEEYDDDHNYDQVHHRSIRHSLSPHSDPRPYLNMDDVM